jgi:hypothetical protein
MNKKETYSKQIKRGAQITQTSPTSAIKTIVINAGTPLHCWSLFWYFTTLYQLLQLFSNSRNERVLWMLNDTERNHCAPGHQPGMSSSGVRTMRTSLEVFRSPAQTKWSKTSVSYLFPSYKEDMLLLRRFMITHVLAQVRTRVFWSIKMFQRRNNNMRRRHEWDEERE